MIKTIASILRSDTYRLPIHGKLEPTRQLVAHSQNGDHDVISTLCQLRIGTVRSHISGNSRSTVYPLLYCGKSVISRTFLKRFECLFHHFIRRIVVELSSSLKIYLEIVQIQEFIVIFSCSGLRSFWLRRHNNTSGQHFRHWKKLVILEEDGHWTGGRYISGNCQNYLGQYLLSSATFRDRKSKLVRVCSSAKFRHFKL